jgi:hypothetical protein
MQRNVSCFCIGEQALLWIVCQVSELQLFVGARLTAEADVPWLAKVQCLLTVVACRGNVERRFGQSTRTTFGVVAL